MVQGHHGPLLHFMESSQLKNVDEVAHKGSGDTTTVNIQTDYQDFQIVR